MTDTELLVYEGGDVLRIRGEVEGKEDVYRTVAHVHRYDGAVVVGFVRGEHEDRPEPMDFYFSYEVYE